MQFAAYIAVSFLTYFYILEVLFCTYGCVYCVLLFNFYIMYSYCYVYVFLLLYMFRSSNCVSLCRSVYCLCVNVYCTTATGCQTSCN
jgi:hypothetical protein